MSELQSESAVQQQAQSDQAGQPGDDEALKASILAELKAQFTVTKISDDFRDVVTPGTIFTLRSQDGILLCSTDSKVPLTSYYEDGHISLGAAGKTIWNQLLRTAQPAANSTNIPQRKFIEGEKLWLTGYGVFKAVVILGFGSDPIDGTRYYGQLRFAFPGGRLPSPEEVMKTIAEVVTVENGSQNPSAAYPAIAPPSAPADAPPPPPKTISLGQTKDQVTASFGQPQKVVHLGAKEIYFYPDMKVTFVNGKVSDVQ